MVKIYSHPKFEENRSIPLYAYDLRPNEGKYRFDLYKLYHFFK